MTRARLRSQRDAPARLVRRAVEPFVKTFGLRVHAPPLTLPVGKIGQVWHERQAADPAALWLRETIADIALTV